MLQIGFNRTIKDITIFILILLLAITSITSLIYYSQNEEYLSQKAQSINSTVIIEKVSAIGELATTKYFYSNVVSYKDNVVINNVTMPFTEKGFLIKYDGYLKAGIDLSTLEILSQSEESIEISIPKAKILDHSIDEKSIIVYDEKNSVFNNISIKEVFDVIVKENKSIENKIIEKGFLEEANKNTSIAISNILKDMGFKSVNIILKE